jgi:hypothetical protein
MPDEKLPAWMIELAEQVGMIEPGTILPTGVIVGSAMIAKCERVDSGQLPVASVKLRDPSLLATNNSLPLASRGCPPRQKPRKPHGHPQPVWFKPFD